MVLGSFRLSCAKNLIVLIHFLGEVRFSTEAHLTFAEYFYIDFTLTDNVY